MDEDSLRAVQNRLDNLKEWRERLWSMLRPELIAEMQAWVDREETRQRSAGGKKRLRIRFDPEFKEMV